MSGLIGSTGSKSGIIGTITSGNWNSTGAVNNSVTGTLSISYGSSGTTDAITLEDGGRLWFFVAGDSNGDRQTGTFITSSSSTVCELSDNAFNNYTATSINTPSATTRTITMTNGNGGAGTCHMKYAFIRVR